MVIPAPPADAIVTRTGVIWLAGGILYFRALAAEPHARSDAEENVRLALGLCAGRRFPMLIDMRAARDLSREARAHYADPEAVSFCCALALLIDSPLGVVLGNFFTRVNRPPYPVQIFRDEAEALAWLEATCRQGK